MSARSRWSGSTLALLASGVLACGEAADRLEIYTDKDAASAQAHPSGWMADHQDLSLDDAHAIDPHSGATCLRIAYSGRGSGGHGWAGIYWQDTPNNWGDAPGRLDLRPFSALTFWARGAVGGETIAALKVGGIAGAFPDSATVLAGPVRLTTRWTRHTIDLGGADLSRVAGAFALAFSREDAPHGAVIYVDDVLFE